MNRNDLSAVALGHLECDPVRYMDMILPIRRGTANVLHADIHGVLLRETVSGGFFLTAQTPEDVQQLLALIDSEPSLMCVHQDFAAKECERQFHLITMLHCNQAVWMGTEPPKIRHSLIRMDVLSLEMAEIVYATYSHDIGMAYIENRLRAGVIIGAFVGGELAGFIGQHEEGSIGMLEVLPKYRRMGVASQLIAHLCGKLLEQGLTPYSQFSVLNEASQKLHKRMGFSTSLDNLYWLEVSKN